MRLGKKLASNKMVSLMKKRVDKAFRKLNEKSMMFCLECVELSDRPHYKHDTTERWVRFTDVEEQFRAK